MTFARAAVFAAALIPALFAADVPRPPKAMAFPAPNGATIDTSKYAGKVIALEFLLTYCSHCQTVSSALQKLQDEYGPRGFQVLGVATNTDKPADIEAFRQRHGLKFPVGWAKREDAHAYLQHPVMVAMRMPQLVFIDRKGVIRAQYIGSDPIFEESKMIAALRKQIEALLK